MFDPAATTTRPAKKAPDTALVAALRRALASETDPMLREWLRKLLGAKK